MPPAGPPNLYALIDASVGPNQPLAIVLAGHNGSGKSTLWYDTLADKFQMPLVNADRLTLSLLPPVGSDKMLKPWASHLRDTDERWHRLAQSGVRLFMDLAMDQRMPFAFETVFSHLEKQPDGTVKSKADMIRTLQAKGYFVVLLFVGLASAELSILRVSTRRRQGGHAVPEEKLRTRFPRTQEAIRLAAAIADLTVMSDNSRGIAEAFTIVRAQRKQETLYDCRDSRFAASPELVKVASRWLANVAPNL